MIRHKDHELELFEKYDILNLCDFIFREESAEEQAKLNRLQLCLNYYLQELVDDLLEAARVRKMQRCKNWKQMQLLMKIYGFTSNGHMTKCDANQLRIHLSESKVKNIVQQVSELASLKLNDFHAEESEADLAEWLVSSLKSKVSSLTAAQLQEAGAHFSHLKCGLKNRTTGCEPCELTIVNKQNWKQEAIKAPQMKRPLDMCLLPGEQLVVADCESGILVFDNTGSLCKVMSCIQGRSLCYDAANDRLIIAIQRDEKALFFSSKFEYLFESSIPTGDPGLQLRCSSNGMMFCVTNDTWTSCLRVHCYMDNEWKTVAHIPDAVYQFFSLATALPIRGQTKPNLSKLLLVSDSGTLYEIMVERCHSALFKQVRSTEIDNLALKKPTAIAVGKNEDIFIYDSGLVHIITPDYHYKRSLSLMDDKLMVTTIIPTPTTVYVNAINNRCIAALSLE